MEKSNMGLLKYIFFFFNLLFWVSGLVLIVVGTIIYSRNGEYFKYADSKFASAEIFIIIIGVVVFVIGFFGCCGAIKENFSMIGAFVVLMGIVVILEIVAGALGFKYRSHVDGLANKALTKAVTNYRTQQGARKILDWVQPKLKCCGNIGPNDYGKGSRTCHSLGQAVPSCHHDGTCKGALFTAGCKAKFVVFMKENMALIGGVAIGVAVIEVVGIVTACFLMNAIKREYEVV